MNITTSGDTAICQGTSVTLQASGGERYVWTPAPSLNDPEQPAPVATPDSSTTYQVIGYSKGDCQTDTAQVHVTVHNKPEVNAGEDQTVPTGSVIQLQATGSPDVVQWNWTPQDYLSCTHCADPVSTPRSPVTYTVEGTNGFGCSTEDDMKITLVCAEGAVYIPNTFTPNGDGVNDVFYPRGKGVQQVLYLHIYNRWGQLVFSRTHFQLNDKSAGWNGTFRGEKLLPDVFMYSASMVCDDNKVFEVKGSITLLR
jgi:gliding motility-associated-like protein